LCCSTSSLSFLCVYFSVKHAQWPYAAEMNAVSFLQIHTTSSRCMSHQLCLPALPVCVLLLPAAVCSGTVNGPCSATGQCHCFATVQGATCSASNMLNFPAEFNIAQLGNGGGCQENLCNAVAAKQGLSAACCPLPCANGRK
jgi:hypothetical protein